MNEQPLTLDTETFDLPALLCPGCGGNNLHHTGLRWFERGEDADRTRVIELDQGSVSISTQMSEVTLNPSSRRDGLFIKFYCENCNERPRLAIYQHKGNTFTGWMQR